MEDEILCQQLKIDSIIPFSKKTEMQNTGAEFTHHHRVNGALNTPHWAR